MLHPSFSISKVHSSWDLMFFVLQTIEPCKYQSLLIENESLLTKPNMCNKMEHLQSHPLQKKYSCDAKIGPPYHANALKEMFGCPLGSKYNQKNHIEGHQMSNSIIKN
jgi:hypothetical protein